MGPLDNYAGLGTASQGVLMFLILAERLELFAILLLFHPDLWRPHGAKGIMRRG